MSEKGLNNKQYKNIVVTGADGELLKVAVKPTISFVEMTNLVNNVADYIFIDEVYYPEFYDIALVNVVFAYYTDISVDGSVETLNEYMYSTDIFDKVLSVINVKQYDNIIDAIYNKIDYKKQELLSGRKQEFDKVLEQVNQFVGLFESVTEKCKDIDYKQIIEIGQKIAQKDEATIVKSILEAQKLEQQ